MPVDWSTKQTALPPEYDAYAIATMDRDHASIYKDQLEEKDKIITELILAIEVSFCNHYNIFI